MSTKKYQSNEKKYAREREQLPYKRSNSRYDEINSNSIQEEDLRLKLKRLKQKQEHGNKEPKIRLDHLKDEVDSGDNDKCNQHASLEGRLDEPVKKIYNKEKSPNKSKVEKNKVFIESIKEIDDNEKNCKKNVSSSDERLIPPDELDSDESDDDSDERENILANLLKQLTKQKKKKKKRKYHDSSDEDSIKSNRKKVKLIDMKSTSKKKKKKKKYESES